MVLSAKIILIVIAGCFLAAFMDSMAGGNLLGAKLAIKNGSRIVRPTVVVVLLLLAVKILWDFLFAA